MARFSARHSRLTPTAGLCVRRVRGSVERRPKPPQERPKRARSSTQASRAPCPDFWQRYAPSRVAPRSCHRLRAAHRRCGPACRRHAPPVCFASLSFSAWPAPCATRANAAETSELSIMGVRPVSVGVFSARYDARAQRRGETRRDRRRVRDHPPPGISPLGEPGERGRDKRAVNYGRTPG